jgi:pSer/pThr/pTyr-binding forkhead associated (FHA) protein
MAIVLRITHDGNHHFLDISKAIKPLVFGRTDDCDYTIKNDGCSGLHLELTNKGSFISILDLESKNGSFINGSKFSKDKLYVDDILQIGEAFIELHTDSLTTVEENKLKSQRKTSGRPQGNLTIPDLSRSQKAKDKLINEKKPRHGFNELTNITGIVVEKVSKMLKRNRKEKKEEES